MMSEKEMLSKNRFLQNKKSFIFLLILCLGVGFAFLSSQLTITGNTSVSGNKWSVYFDNVQITEGSVDASVVPTTSGTITTSLNYTVTLDKPGDYYEFTVDAVNAGTIDAMIDSITTPNIDSSVLQYVNYSATYEDGTPLAQNDVLEAEDTITYKVRVEYKRDIQESDLLDADFDLNLSFMVNYVQSTYTKERGYGQIWNFDYTGGEQIYTIPKTGIYKLEVWGAQGGTYDSGYPGGYGGYSTGLTSLSKDDNLYINVGGQGLKWTSGTSVAGGYNGGGSVTLTSKNSSSGGGATHIALDSGLLSTFDNKRNRLLIVAGGGGGGAAYSSAYLSYIPGGAGGGYKTNNKNSYSGHMNPTILTTYGASQSPSTGTTYSWSNRSNSLGTFGKGGNTMGESEFSSGGGGGYYGGGGSFGIGGGAGGSGYIGNTNLSDKVMYCYSCPQSNDENIKTVSTTNVSSTATSNYAKTGNGYAKITYLGSSNINFGNWKKTNNSTDINNYNFDMSTGKITFTTSLNNTTNYAEFTFDIENNTDDDYYISSIKKGNYDISKVNYTVSNTDGTDINVNKMILSKEKKTIKVKVQLLDSNYTLTNSELSLIVNLKKATKSEDYVGMTFVFGYKGSEATLKVPQSGKYKLEVWGAQGGTYDSGYPGGYGGYSTGVTSLSKDDNLYINVGGQGLKWTSGTSVAGGYNGGGSVTLTNKNSSSGGGATHIALDSGLLSTFDNKRNRLLIVAGGGGGGAAYSSAYLSYIPGGAGGGYKTNNKNSYSGNMNPTILTTYGASQSPSTGTTYSWSNRSNSLGTFGKGGDTMGEVEFSSGGGGGYYGGGGSFGIGGGAGGSGYIGNTNLSDKVMYCYSCPQSNDENIKTVSTTNVSSTATSKYAKTGNGYAKITYLGN